MSPLLLLVFVAALAAFAASTIAGGGAGLVLLPLLGLVVPAAQVPAALSIGTAASAVSRVALFRRAIRWRVVAWFVPAALPAVALGAALLTFVQPLYLELALGLVLVGNCVAMLRAPAPPRPGGAGRIVWLAAGAAGGFLSGFAGAVGLVLNGFYLRAGLDRQEIVATRAANEILLHLVKLGLYASLGLLTREALVAGGLVAVAATLAPLGARHLLAGLDERLFRRIGQATACLAGAAMLTSAGTSLAAQNGLHVGGRIGLSGIEARLSWRAGAASLTWADGRAPELEHTTELAALPATARGLVESLADGAERVVCERVLRIGASGYEVTIVKGGAHMKIKV